MSDRLSAEQRELAESVMRELAETASEWERLEREAAALDERHQELVTAARMLGLLAG